MAALLSIYLVGLFLAALALPLLLSAGAAPGLVVALRTLGLLAVSLAHTLLGTLGVNPWGGVALACSFSLVFAGGLWALLSTRRVSPGMLSFDRSDALRGEVIFAVAYAVAAWLTAHDAAVFGTERLMDFALLQATTSADRFPPADVWFAGARVNYYWFGHHMAAMLGRLGGVPVEQAYNLLLAYTFGLAAQLCYGLGRRFGQGPGVAALGAVLVMLAGNLQPVSHWVTQGWSGAFSLYDASRVIPYTITEFPLLSLLVGDLHAHYLSLPLLLLFILCLPDAGRLRVAVAVVLANLSVVAIALANPWSLAAVLLLFGLFRVLGHNAWPWWSLLPGLLVLPLIWPVQGQGIALAWVAGGARSPIAAFVLVWGIPLLLLGGLLDWRARLVRLLRHPVLWGGALLLAWGFGPAAALCLVLALAVLTCHRPDAARWAALAAAGLILVSFPEVIFLRDPYSPPYERMNTVFKFSYAAWPMLMLAATHALHRGWVATGSWWWGFVRRLGLGAVLAFLAGYPAAALTQRLDAPLSLPLWDGLAPLRGAHAEDLALAAWLRTASVPGDVCLEAPGASYTWSGRIGALVGCPVPLGWEGHQIVWRGAAAAAGVRRAEVDALYTASDPQARLALLGKYRIRWVVVASAERARYAPEHLAVWDEMLPLAYAAGTARVYRVDP